MHLVMIGGSDAGISAALRARELDPGADVTVVVADAYPNFSICGIPYYLSGEVGHWRNLAHRTIADLEATGMRLRLDTTARRVDVAARKLLITGGGEELLGYDKLIVGTGAVPVRPSIGGLAGPDGLGVPDGVHLLHSMGDTFAVMRTLEDAAPADMVLVVVGVRPETTLAAEAGATLGVKGAIAIDTQMRTGLPDVFAAGDCVVTHHRLLGVTYLPLGTTAHKQGRVAGENALGGNRQFAGSLGTQVVKIFDQAAARTGLRDHEAAPAGFDPVTVESQADDHKAYYPGSHKITMRVTGDRETGRLLGMQLFGHKNAEIAKRIDIAATAIFHGMTVDGLSDLDLSYTPPLGSPWEAVQMGAQAWIHATQR